MQRIEQRYRMSLYLYRNRFQKIISIFLIVLFFLSGFTYSSESTGFDDKLQIAIEQAESELKAERARIQKELDAQKNELEQITTECKNFSGEIIERKIALAQKQNEIQQIRRQRETLWAERTQFEKDVSRIKSICLDAKTELTELLEMLPVSENRSEQKQLLAGLDKLSARDSFDVKIPSLFRLIELLLSESRTSSIYSADILDSHGYSQSARMLRIGQSMFAYYIPDSERVAIAISDPYQQGGYRWYEQLSINMKQSIVNAISQAQKSEGIFLLPIDVTGTMSASTNLSSKSLQERFRSGGFVMYPLIVVALWLLVLIAERIFVLVPAGSHSIQFCEQILELCNNGNFDKAEQLAQKRKGIVHRILGVCLSNRKKSEQVLDDAVQEAFLHELPGLERFLPSIRMLSTIAPMLGLLGTVTGIIATFDVITIAGGGRPQLLAGGISEALITTVTGLSIAIPGLLAHSFLSGRVEKLIADAERFAASLSNILKHKQFVSQVKAEKTNDNN